MHYVEYPASVTAEDAAAVDAMLAHVDDTTLSETLVYTHIHAIAWLVLPTLRTCME